MTWKKRLLVSGLCVLPVIALIRTVNELVVNCSGAFSEDYFPFVLNIDFLLRHGLFHLERYYYGTHFIPVPFLLCLTNSVIFGWNMHVELIFNFLIFPLRIWIVWLIAGASLRESRGIALVSSMIALQFLPMEISVFDYALSGIPAGMATLGFCLAVFFLQRSAQSPRFLHCAGWSALISSYSIGTTIPCLSLIHI